MIRPNPPALHPAGAAWGALIEIAANVRALPDAAAAWNLARSTVPVRRALRRRPHVRVGAGRAIEAIPGPRRGSPLLAPAAGALENFDEVREGVALYRVIAAGRIEGRAVEEGAVVVVARRPPERGAVVAIADGRAVRLCVAGAGAPWGVPAEARVLGVVEAIVGRMRGAA